MRVRNALDGGLLELEKVLAVRTELRARQDKRPFVLRHVRRDERVGAIERVQFAGLWEVALEVRGVYLDLRQVARVSAGRGEEGR